MTMSRHQSAARDAANLGDVRQVDFRKEPVAAAREKLRAAHTAKRAAEAEAEQAAQAVERARRLHEDAAHALRELDARDEEDRAAQAENLKAYARDGTLPVSLSLDPERAHVRRNLESNAAAAKRAHDDLAAEHAAAMKRAGEAGAQVQLAAADVVRAKAVQIAAEMKVALETAWACNADLAAIARLWVSGGPLRLSGEVTAQIDRFGPPWTSYGTTRANNPKIRAAEGWRGVLNELARNPDAELPA